MKLGIENKKALYALIVLGAGALYGVYNSFSSLSGSSSTPAPSRTATAAAPPSVFSVPEPQSAGPPRVPANAGKNDEFRPKLRSKRPEDRIDPTGVDPTLRLDLLAKLQEAPAAGGGHNLFQIGPPPPKVEPLKGVEPTIAAAKPQWGPRPLPPPPGPPPPPPPRQAVPINVKYYGWAAPTGSSRKKAFFLDGDDVIVKAEGETVKGHYRVVRIGPTSVVIEDNNDKLQQTLTKVEDAQV